MPKPRKHIAPQRITPDLTVDEFAQAVNKSAAAVRREVNHGDIPSYKIGGCRRIPREYLDTLRREAFATFKGGAA